MEITRRGDLETVQTALAVFGKELSEMQLVDFSITGFAYQGHFAEAIELAKSQPRPDQANLFTKLAGIAYLKKEDEAFEKAFALSGRRDDEQSAFVAGMSSRKELITEIDKRRQTLGISMSWDEILTSYRLGPCILVADQKMMDEALASADSDDPGNKIRAWFCWGALAAADSRVNDLNQSRFTIDAIMQEEKILPRLWLPEILFLATAAGDIHYVKQRLAVIDRDTHCEPALIASGLALNLNPEVRSYINSQECLSWECADSFVIFLKKQDSSPDYLYNEIARLEKDSIRMQLFAKLL